MCECRCNIRDPKSRGIIVDEESFDQVKKEAKEPS
jgi:hypothetical protein